MEYRNENEIERKDRILIIEDDEELREGLEYVFSSEGYQVECLETKRSAWRSIQDRMPDAILMDCNLPDGNGFELCKEIRKSSSVPILMLTARDSELDEVKALELGVDDYMSKPFSIAVLKARLKRILKPKANRVMQSGQIMIDLKSCKVTKAGIDIDLSSVEYRLLLYLVQNTKQVLSKEQIITHIWDDKGEFVDDNIVSVNIRRLRMKLEDDPKNPERIKTIHGIGYIWRE